MADSRRVFVQLARADGAAGVVRDPPVMAFVVATDAWPAVVNEFLMSCHDDELEPEQRASGVIDSCRVLHASSLERVADASAFEDGKQYVLCESPAVYQRVLQQNGLPAPIEEGAGEGAGGGGGGDTDAGGGADAPRDSIVAASAHLESLEELQYYFDDSGTLRHCGTNQAVVEMMRDERRAEELDEIVKAAIFHIQMEMLDELDFKQARVPLDPRPEEPMEARASVFLTADWRANKDLLVVINGGRGVQPGIWSRDLLIQEGLELGSMLPVFRRAKSSGLAVAVLNPFTNNVTVGNQLFPIRGSASPDEHALYVWDHIISRAQARNVFVLAYSFGAKSVLTLLQHREAQLVQRVSAIVFAEGAYRLDPASTSPLVGNFLKQRAINFKADAQVPVGAHLPSAEAQLSCSCLSVGDLSAAAAEARSPSSNGHHHAHSSNSSSSSSSSNKARTISLSLDSTFAYFLSARDRKCTAAQFIAEAETKTRSWLGKAIRHRLDSLKPRKQGRRLSSVADPSPRKGARRESMGDTSAMRASILDSRRSSTSASASSLASASVSVSDFDLIKVIGKGSIGKVFLVRKKDTHGVFAMKVLRKKNVVRHGLEEHIKTERLILEEIDHPFIARLRFSFQTKDKLYLVTDYCSGGELFHHMSDAGFSYELSRFYAAELVLGLEHLHELKVAYRDLKPENILLEASGHVRITDFGLSKLNVVSDSGAQTIVGSPEYLAPEVYAMHKYGVAVDWWSLGVFVFEMLTGEHPFFDDNREAMVRKILTPDSVLAVLPPAMPAPAASLVRGLLTFDPSARLGARGAGEIRAHAFFAGVDWDALRRREAAPPWRPVVRDELDVGNFDAEFTSEPVVDSVCTHQSSALLSDTFANFTFDPTRSSASSSSVRRR